jgi:hypothetical protein
MEAAVADTGLAAAVREVPEELEQSALYGPVI